MDNEALDALRAIVGSQRVLVHEPLSRHTSLRLGGPADAFVSPAVSEQIPAVLAAAKQFSVPLTILGNGSNVLVLDGGIRGVVLHIGDGMAQIAAPEPLPGGEVAVAVEAGCTLAKLAGAAASLGLSGLAFAAGIPGTIGGAVYMNAGAYGGEMKDVVTEVNAYDRMGSKLHFSNADMQFGYRKSRFSNGQNKEVIVSTTLVLKPGREEDIRREMRSYAAKRREKQPVTLPSCGSTFQRPEGHFAGTLIEQCGLKGFRIGGASVSTLHAGFLLNDGAGTSADYLALIRHVQQTVREKTGIWLEPEVRILGDEHP